MGSGVSVCMRKWNQWIVVVIVFLLCMFIGGNFFLVSYLPVSQERQYRVEVGRLAREIEEGGLDQVHLSKCSYVTHIQRRDGGDAAFFDANSDYVIRVINGEMYRFDYVLRPAEERYNIVIAVNVVFVGLSFLLLAIMLYIREKILKPFFQLRDIPYELSKGNLTVPLKENKNRYFGRFVWGVDLLRETLEQRRQRELELHREKKTLVLSISHDIKTPLSAIKLYARALSRGLYEEPGRAAEIAGCIEAKTSEIERFVSQIIQASNEGFLDIRVEVGEFYLSELVDGVAVYYKEKLELARISFSIGDYEDCILKGDRERAAEVIQNTMENAIKYGDGGSIEIVFSEEEDCRLVTVRNSGCTLPAGELPHIFDSFWRGSNTGSHPGSGLGLYICRQIMHKMDGEIFAQMEGGCMCMTAVFRKMG